MSAHSIMQLCSKQIKRCRVLAVLDDQPVSDADEGLSYNEKHEFYMQPVHVTRFDIVVNMDPSIQILILVKKML